MWKNIVEPESPQMTTWRVRISCWMPKATNTHSECVMLIAFPLQQWLHERATMLYVHCLFCLICLGKSNVVPAHCVKASGVVKAHLRSFLISALDGVV